MQLSISDVISISTAKNVTSLAQAFCELLFKELPCLRTWIVLDQAPDHLIVFFGQSDQPLQQQTIGFMPGLAFAQWQPTTVQQCLLDLDFSIEPEHLQTFALAGLGFWVFESSSAAAESNPDMTAMSELLATLLRNLSDQHRAGHREHFSEETESRMAALIAELRQARQRADEASRTKSIFLANISHELRTPLNGVLGLGEVLEGTALDDHQRGLLKTLNESGTALKQLIDSLLDFSFMENRKVELECEPFELRQFASAILEGHRDQLKQGVKLDLSLSDNVPKFICADPIRLGQVLRKLLTNAIQFTNQGHISLHLKCVKRLSGDTGCLHFEVADSGIGIAKDKHERIFDAFYQADSSRTRQQEGVGLGLSISKRLVELMGGRLRLQSSIGVGSQFWFQLMLPMSDQLEPLLQQPPSPTRQQFNNASIMLVEDNYVNQLVTQRMLCNLGCNVEIANNGLEALNLLQDRHFDLIFMDISMPIMDGLEATRRIREFDVRESTHTLVIALTAHAVAGDREKCLASGMDDYLSKPARAEQLQQMLAKWLK